VVLARGAIGAFLLAIGAPHAPVSALPPRRGRRVEWRDARRDAAVHIPFATSGPGNRVCRASRSHFASRSRAFRMYPHGTTIFVKTTARGKCVLVTTSFRLARVLLPTLCTRSLATPKCPPPHGRASGSGHPHPRYEQRHRRVHFCSASCAKDSCTGTTGASRTDNASNALAAHGLARACGARSAARPSPTAQRAPLVRQKREESSGDLGRRMWRAVGAWR
jgi:hypothetical protein